MAVQNTNILLQSGKGNKKVPVQVQIQIDPNDPQRPPSIIDKDTGDIIGQWDNNSGAFVGLGGDTVGNNQQVDSFIAQNQSQLKSATTNAINDLNPSQKNGFANGGVYSTGVQGSATTPSGDGTATAASKSIQGGNQAPQATLLGVSAQAANLRYPSTISGDFVLFEIYEYAGSNVTLGENFGLQTARKGSKVTSIALPIQASIIDNNSVDWKEDTLNALTAAAGTAALGMLGAEGQEGALDKLVKAAQEASKEGADSDLAKAIQFAAASAAVNSNLRSRFSGEVMNPNLELLFNGPRLRNFNFAFLMSARDDAEAKTIRQIIRQFKEKMSVRDGAGSLFLRAPHVFQISYMTDQGSLHPAINRIKLAALTSFNVNYTPAGTYSTFEDYTMTAYQMTMQFTELDPVYESDYEGLSQNEIGF